MKSWLLALLTVFFTVGFAIEQVEARRLGGARSIGAQRQAAPPPQPPAKSAQSAPAPAQNAAPAASAPARSGMGRWLAPLAGLAAGLGLASLFGEQLGSIVLVLLIALIFAFILRALIRAMARPALQVGQGVQYTSLGQETVAAPPPSQTVGGTAPDIRAQFAPAIPAGFDVDVFLRQAKRNFIALQEANDRNDLGAIRDLVSNDLYESLKQDIETRLGAGQQTDVLTLNADLLEVVTESGMHWASIRFSGMLREANGGGPTQFEEIWNLQKPEDGSTGWVLAGIQQVS